MFRSSSTVLHLARIVQIAVLAHAAVALGLVPSTARAATTLPSGFTTSQFVSGLARPYQMGFAPDGRVFVSQQGGKLRVVKNGALLATPFVTVPVDTAGDRGLIGVAFDPSFAVDPWVYVYYTATTPTIHNRVSRFRALGDVAVAGSEQVLMDFETLGTSTTHNGGSLNFGPDGKLYITTGENAQQGGTLAQSMTSLLGKALRINRDGTIPEDNPFYATATGNYRAIFSLGLRNPFTSAIQPGTGRWFINDVGAGTWEEINDAAAGKNYGWPNTEGQTSDPRFTSPLFAYNHGWTDTTGCAISGGTFYNPATPQFPAGYVGDYFFADYCTGWIRRFDPADGSVTPYASGVEGPVDMDIGADGNLYYLTRSMETGNPGAIYKVQYSPKPAIETQPSDATIALGESATFSVTASGEEPLSYQWQRDGADIAGATSSGYTLSGAGAGDDGARFRVVVSNGAGTVTSSEATLTVSSNARPQAVILTPQDGTKYNAGSSISFTASATDAEDGTLPASAYAWELIFHHHTHTHPGPNVEAGPTGDGRSGSMTIADEGETDTDVYYEISLTVTDSDGATRTVSRNVTPNVSTVSIQSTPTSADDGLVVTVDGQPFHTPYSTPSVVGMKRVIGAVTPQVMGSDSYEFTEWSDGGAATHEIVTGGSDATFTAAFRSVGDIVAPETTIDSGPTMTRDATPDFAFSSGEAGSTFECAVDSGSFGACASPTTLATLADGQHVFAVRATDPAGNVDATPATKTFTVDTLGPQVAVTSPTLNQIVSGTINFAATATDTVGVTGVKWYIDEVEVASDYNGAPWTKTWNTTAVADGSHKVFAKARDAAGNWTTSAKFNFTIRNTVYSGLDTIIDSAPALTNDATPDFLFSATQPEATFECQIDNGSFEACTSPKTLPAQTDGSHTFSVRALASGAVDSTPASQAFTVDTTKPAVSVSSPVAGSTVAGVITLGANATDASAVTGAKWFLDAIEVASDYDGAPWSRSLDTNSLTDGSHKLYAKARDAAGNWGSSATITFSVRNTPLPALDTTIDSGPGLTNDSTPDFSFSATRPGATFECKVDGGSYAPCTSPFTLPAQTDGGHVLSVRATEAGETDATPATHDFTVDTTRPAVSLTAPAAAAIVSGSVTLSASATDGSGVTAMKWYVDGVEVVSDYDGAPWSRLWSSGTVTNGTHKMFAKARDAAGNWGTSKTISFTVSN